MDNRKKTELEIYVIMHKEKDLYKKANPDIYKRLMVGKKEYPADKILLDSTGNNISVKNKNYCELTGLYWIWKNTSNKYTGLCHYRRFFINKFRKVLNKEEILKILDNYDIILPTHVNEHMDIYHIYEREHCISDLQECRKIIEEIYPDYLKSFDVVMKGRKFYPFNMFIMKKELLDKYCEWLFSIFEILEKRINISERDDYQKRIFGFLSERLTYVWVLKNNLKVHENFILNTEFGTYDRIKDYTKYLLRLVHLY